jgi:hypothetical protein
VFSLADDTGLLAEENGDGTGLTTTNVQRIMLEYHPRIFMF